MYKYGMENVMQTRPYSYPWHYEFAVIRTFGSKHQIEKHPTKSFYLASIDHGRFLHGPVHTENEALACVNATCSCWKKKREQSAARKALVTELEAKAQEEVQAA
jgi:hypothetical protein